MINAYSLKALVTCGLICHRRQEGVIGLEKSRKPEGRDATKAGSMIAKRYARSLG